MSAVTAWDVPQATVRRRHLSVVADESVCRPADSPMRLTRRGRVLLVAVAALMVLAAFSITRAVASESAVPLPTVTVTQGQTLSEVAAAQLPTVPLSEAIYQIQRANGLGSSQVSAGQTLSIPRV